MGNFSRPQSDIRPRTAEVDRSFEKRYGKRIVSRTIGTLPALVLRWQARLGLRDEHIVTIATILSFYSSPPNWPSVSMEKMATWRGVSWNKVNKTVRELEALGYLIRPGRDSRHGGSYFYDLSLLFRRLEACAEVEEVRQRLRGEAQILEDAILGVSTSSGTNREQEQSTETEDNKRVLEKKYWDREQPTEVENTEPQESPELEYGN